MFKSSHELDLMESGRAGMSVSGRELSGGLIQYNWAPVSQKWNGNFIHNQPIKRQNYLCCHDSCHSSTGLLSYQLYETGPWGWGQTVSDLNSPIMEPGIKFYDIKYKSTN